MLHPLKTLFALGIAGLLLMPFLAAPASAKDRLLAEYVADLGPEDHVNSSGKRLTTLAALLAQDRANYHRFGVRHKNDGADPIFSKRAMRAQIRPAVVKVESYLRAYIKTVLANRGKGGTYMVVSVYGSGDRITRISIVVPG